MVKLIFLKEIQLKPEYGYETKDRLIKRGEVVDVDNNTAHGLIEMGIARLYRSIEGRETSELVSPQSIDKDKRTVKPRKKSYKTT